jgi:tRNA pseudouridine55 synthase
MMAVGDLERGGAEDRLLLIDKPADWTSFDVVHRLRSLLHVRKVGHAGTLDPKATGLMLVCTGRWTKRIEEFVSYEKEYEGTLELGVRTDTFDSEGNVLEVRDAGRVTEEQLRSAARHMIGVQEQVPPMFSAVKYQGKPLYEYARRGKTVPRTARVIEVFEFDITRVAMPFADFRTVCSKGTYVRSLIDALGQRLECGATLRSLRRTRIGPYHIAQALTIEQVADLRHHPRESGQHA